MVLTLDAPTPISRFRMAPNARSVAAERRRREQELRQALQGGELALSFSGRVSLASGTVDAAEAVVRWPRRRRGQAPSCEVAPLAESTGMAAKIGGWVLLEACQAAAGWDYGVVSLDVSASHAADDGLLDQVAAALDASGLAPDRLELELSEHALGDCSDECMLRLAALRDLGVGVALDEFGAGAASLSLLRRLPLTTVKFDGLLLRDVAAGRENRAILRAVVQAAHALDLHTVATGVETEEERTLLASLLCDAAQGPLFGAPYAAAWSGPG